MVGSSARKVSTRHLGRVLPATGRTGPRPRGPARASWSAAEMPTGRPLALAALVATPACVPRGRPVKAASRAPDDDWLASPAGAFSARQWSRQTTAGRRCVRRTARQRPSSRPPVAEALHTGRARKASRSACARLGIGGGARGRWSHRPALGLGKRQRRQRASISRVAPLSSPSAHPLRLRGPSRAARPGPAPRARQPMRISSWRRSSPSTELNHAAAVAALDAHGHHAPASPRR